MIATTCAVCGYNLPHHAFRCPAAGKSDLQWRLEYANMSDARVSEACVRCGHAIGGGGAVIDGDGLAHRFDCTRPGVWA